MGMLGKLPIDVNDMNIDLMSMSGHKIYGPKGIGTLYVQLCPVVLRSGTLPHFLCVGTVTAAEQASHKMSFGLQWISGLSSNVSVNDILRLYIARTC